MAKHHSTTAAVLDPPPAPAADPAPPAAPEAQWPQWPGQQPPQWQQPPWQPQQPQWPEQPPPQPAPPDPVPPPAAPPAPPAAGAQRPAAPGLKGPGVALFGAPPLLGKTPTTVQQLLANFGGKATHFTGPVVSGGTPGAATVAGSALCALMLRVDYTMGNFTLPILFPADSILLWCTQQAYTAFTGGTLDTTFALGRTSGGAEILAATNMGALHAAAIEPVISSLPLSSDAPTFTPFQAYLTVAQSGNTAGQGVIVIIFARGFNVWT
jgi:hypothetical protein